jgi:hypothetical protein
MSDDIWAVLEKITADFNKRVGLTELLYGPTQEKPANEAEEK